MIEKAGAVIDAHATHWASLYPDAPEAIRARIKSVVARSTIIAQVELPEARAMPNGAQADTLTAMAEGDGDVRHMVLLLTERETSSGCVLSAFPFAAGAITHPVKIDHVASSGSGAEGQIRGRTEDGAEISFFDPLFFKNGSDYQVGESYQFALSAFAYSLRPFGLKVVQGGDMIAPTDVLKPARTGASDDYEFRATVQHVYPMRLESGTVYRMRATVARSGRSMVDVALYAAEHVLPAGYRPKPGDEISGRLWLQGYLVED
ncbi:MAG: hypothetical protein KBA31_18325 [Alphaproteobacteria bacterium]|nr:hypothetical protein [Alphaproteobacteria bacterium]